ncbi:PucR family transcriptional regulator [Kineococcus sp. SYSU DK005]|uniref:PucR family transcriptional regulator n=1 Tax=Kineococcus sp. SYSU DK005 TaxID=3383126 RepID=UPI003D7CFC26
MEPTVADVLALPVLAAGAPRVLVGGAGLAAPVRWVHVSEQFEVAGTLGGGELLLSTGMGLLDARFDARRYLATLTGAGAVGLVVELGQHVRALPRELVRAAAAAGFPLVELHASVRFVEVTEQVHARILDEQHERLRFSERVHREFAPMGAGGAGLEEVVQRAAALTGRVVVLEDLGHRAVAFAGGGAAQVLLDWTARSRAAPAAGGGGPEGWLSAPVGPVGRRWGRLVLPAPGREGERCALVLERAAETLTVVRLLEGAAAGGAARGPAVARRAHDDLLRDLLRGRRGDEAELRARARALGLVLRGAFAPLAVHVPEGAEEEVVATAPRALRGAALAGLAGVLRPRVVGVLVSAPAAALAGDAPARLGRALAEGAPGGPGALTLGAAPVAGTLAAAGEGLVEAAHVAEVAASLPHRRPGAVHRAADLGARGLLWRLREDPRLHSWVEAQLAPLLGAPDGGRQLELLRGHLEAGGSMTRLAARLGLSRPAAYGRVERLRERLGRDLDDPEERLALHLALLARELGGADGGSGGGSGGGPRRAEEG